MRRVVDQIVARLDARLRSEHQEAARQRSTLAETEADLRRQVEAYRTQIEALSHDEDPRRQRALSDYAAGREFEAIETLVALQGAEDEADRVSRADRWRQIGALAFLVNTARATQAFERVVQYAPQDSQAWLALADLYNMSDRESEALQALGRALAQAPDGLERARVELALARVLLSRGRLREAGPHFEQARHYLVALLTPERANAEIYREAINMGFQFGRWLTASGDLEGARNYYTTYLRTLLVHFDDPALVEDARLAQAIALSDATMISVRLGDSRSALSYSRELLSARKQAAAETDAAPAQIALFLAAEAAGRVELRFGDAARGRDLLSEASAMARALAERNPSNAIFGHLRAVTLTSLAWSQVLTGRAREADAASTEAVSLLRPVRQAHRADPQISIYFAQALVQAGLGKCVLGDRRSGEALISEGMRTVSPFAAHSAQNKEFERGVWAMWGVAAALNVGRTWEQFLNLSADLERAGIVTSAEVAYAQSMRRDIFRLYPNVQRYVDLEEQARRAPIEPGYKH